MDSLPQRGAPSAFSASRLARPSSQTGRRPTGLLSPAALERMREPQKDGRRPDVGMVGSRPGSRSTSRPQSRGGSSKAAQTPVRRRMVWSQEQLEPHDPGSFPRHDRGVSWSTKRENVSKEQFTVQLDSSQDIGRVGDYGSAQHDPHAESPSGKESIEMVAAAFKEEVTQIDSDIQDGYKRLLMNHLGNDEFEDSKAAEAREAEKRRRQAELTKARLKEKAARDPHKKIQLRLENKRRFEMDTLDKAGIPTTFFESQGLSGREKTQLVDVRALSASCIGLAQGTHSAQGLVDLQIQREKVLRNSTASAPASLTGSSSMPNFGSDSLFSGDSLPSQSGWERRYHKACKQRKYLTSEKIVQKIASMRAEPATMRLSHSFDVFAFCAPESRGDWETSCDGLTHRKGSEETPHSIGAPGAAIHRRSSFRHESGGAHRKSTSACHRRTSKKVSRASPEVLQRVRHLWTCFRGVVRCLTVYFAHMRLMKSADMIKSFMIQLGEWSRIMNAMKRLRISIIALQRTCRGFLNTRNKRCDVILKEWIRVEDHYLHSFCRLYAQRVVDDHQHELEEANTWVSASGKKVTRAPTRKHTQGHKYTKEETKSFADNTWTGLKVPPPVRKAVIHRYYMVELLNHIRNRDNFMKTIQNGMQYERELVKFLKCWGADSGFASGKQIQASEVERPGSIFGKMKVSLPEFWHISEDMVIELMSLAAEALQRPPWHPRFREHPSRKDPKIMGEDFHKYCRIPRKLPEEVRFAISAELAGRFVSRMDLVRAERSVERSRKAERMAEEVESPAASPDGANSHVDRNVKFENGDNQLDIEQVWREFTPRLKEIVHAQSAAWVRSPKEQDTRLDQISDRAVVGIGT